MTYFDVTSLSPRRQRPHRRCGPRKGSRHDDPEIGQELVRLSNAGQSLDAVDKLYGKNIVSIEGAGSDALPQRMEGFDTVRGKSVWWLDNHEIHTSSATGPFCGHRDDQFAVLFEMDVTNGPSGERSQLREVAIYTVDGGKIVQEEFLFLASPVG